MDQDEQEIDWMFCEVCQRETYMKALNKQNLSLLNYFYIKIKKIS